MNLGRPPEKKRSVLDLKSLAGTLLILITIIAAYSNTFQASWHFDDYQTIVNNPYIHLENLKPNSLYHTFFASPDGGKYSGKKLYRPIPNLSFALNWYFGGDSVFGYHITNIAIHFLTAILIFFIILSILDLPKFSDRFRGNSQVIALLSTLLWALHPIQTQAVTYIVQRMAALAAMFSALSLLLYIKGRCTGKQHSQIFLFIGSAVSFLFALASKENTVVFPAAIILAEIIFFQDLSENRGKRVAAITGFAAVVSICLVIMVLTPSKILSGYDLRSFTLSERLMTQPRVLMFHLGQIFFPLPSRFSIEHDFTISSSITIPWTTLPSMTAVIALIIIAILTIRKCPFFSFAVLFYFFNHAVESTVIPLEIVFEHRNYLPSMFLFLPISIGVIHLIKTSRPKNRYVAPLLYAGTFSAVFFLIGSTFLRNDVWKTEKTLWEDAIIKAPGQARSYQNLAFQYYEKIGRYDVALSLYNKALTLHAPNPNRTRAQILTNIGVIHDKAGNYEKAYGLYQEALKSSPKELRPRYNAAMALIGMKKWDDALQQVDDLIKRKPDDKDSNNQKGFILLKIGRPSQAIPFLKKALDNDPNHFNANINMGVALYQLGRFDESQKFLVHAHRLAPAHGLPIFCLLENNLRKNDMEKVDNYLQKLLKSVSFDDIDTVLKQVDTNPFLVPLNKEILLPVISNAIQRIENKRNGAGN